LSGGKPSGWNDSTSGYYLDDHSHGYPIKNALFANIDCGQSNVWDMLSEARANAIRDVKSDLLQALQANRESPIINWRGSIGMRENIGSYLSTASTVGYQLRPKRRMRDAYFMLTGAWIKIDQTKSVNVHVNSNDVEFTATSGVANCVANTWSEFTFNTAVSIPLFNENQWDLRYNVYYEPDGARAIQNKLWCCSPPGWKEHFDVGSFSEAAAPTDDTFIPTHVEGAGLVLTGYFTCNKLDWICNLREMNQYDTQDLISRLIQWNGAINLMNRVYFSGKINYYSLMVDKEFFAHRASLVKRYENTIIWVAQNLPGGVTSCWGCEKNEPQISSLQS
jgi:hypothetical protein